MSEPTEQDRKTALNTWLANDHVEAIAQALADEREKARAPFLAVEQAMRQAAKDAAYMRGDSDWGRRAYIDAADRIYRAAEAAQ